MKKLIIRSFLVVFFILPFRGNTSTAQIPGCSLPISCDHLNDDTYWMISESLYGSKKLSDCASNANYNCHGFVMSYFEESNCPKPGWYNQTQNPYTCPTMGPKYDYHWQNSSKYIKVCLESAGNIAYYHLAQGDTHSSVKETLYGGTYKYISKYGCTGPIVEHNLTGSVYHLKGLVDNGYPVEFWSYIGSIFGNTTINGTGAVTFSVNDISTVNYSWSITSGSQYISVYSGGNQRIVTLLPVHTGTAVLQVSATSPCSGAKTQQVTLNISICLDGTYDNAGIYNQILNTVNHVATGGVFIRVSCPNSTTITWQKTSGNINGYFPNGPTVSFNMTSGGSISLLITAKNGSTTIGSRTVTFYN